MADIKDWANFARNTAEFYQKNRFFGQPVITHTVSKTFKGGHRNDVRETVCVSPETCAHLHFPGAFDCDSLDSHDCDSKASQTFIQGRMTSGYDALFGHADDVPFAKSADDFWERRGVYFGRFQLRDKDDRIIVDGKTDGMINVGPLREPLGKACETCHMVGRWHGSVMAEVRLDRDAVGLLVGTTVFDTRYRRTSSWFATEFVGTLEGMLVRECRKAK